MARQVAIAYLRFCYSCIAQKAQAEAISRSPVEYTAVVHPTEVATQDRSGRSSSGDRFGGYDSFIYGICYLNLFDRFDKINKGHHTLSQRNLAKATLIKDKDGESGIEFWWVLRVRAYCWRQLMPRTGTRQALQEQQTHREQGPPIPFEPLFNLCAYIFIYDIYVL